jgi:hypothetical protein
MAFMVMAGVMVTRMFVPGMVVAMAVVAMTGRSCHNYLAVTK